MSANDTFPIQKVTDPIGSHQHTDKSHYQKPPWAEAGSVIITRPKANLTVWQWIRNALLNVRSRILEQDKAGFTCKECPEPHRAHRRNRWWPYNTAALHDPILWTWISWETRYTERCKPCNRKYARWQRSLRAFKRITDRALPIWFITLTRPNITGIDASSPFVQQADREMWIEDFKKFRRRKIWKDTFAGGYWFYEYTSHAPGDKIFSKDGTFIRQVSEGELNGHLHILATAEDRIPMKALRAAWGDRVDFSQPKKPKDVHRYLRGYLTKCNLEGINMRPFGDIHRPARGNEATPEANPRTPVSR